MSTRLATYRTIYAKWMTTYSYDFRLRQQNQETIFRIDFCIYCGVLVQLVDFVFNILEINM